MKGLTKELEPATQITLHEFINQETKRLHEFEVWWNRQGISRNEFPNELELPDWDEQFNFYLDSKETYLEPIK